LITKADLYRFLLNYDPTQIPFFFTDAVFNEIAETTDFEEFFKFLSYSGKHLVYKYFDLKGLEKYAKNLDKKDFPRFQNFVRNNFPSFLNNFLPKNKEE
jgi:uncharacterized UPF0160 family protein